MAIKFDLLLGKLRESDLGSITPGTTPIIYSWAGDPTGVVTPSKGWDMYLNSDNGGIWIASSAANTSWKEYSFTYNL